MEDLCESGREMMGDAEDSWLMEECPIYRALLDSWETGSEGGLSEDDFLLTPSTNDWLERSLEEHDACNLGMFLWRKCRGLPVYFLQGECLEEACSWDHVREEHRMTFTVPLEGQEVPFDRNSLIPYQWLITDELVTLHRLLEAGSDFIRIQTLNCLKDWTTPALFRKFAQVEGIIPSIAQLILTSNHCGVMRMAACVISLIAKSPKLRNQFITPEGAPFLDQFIKIVTGYTRIRDDGSRCLIAKALSEMTTNDLFFTGYLIRNFNLESLFYVLNTSSDSYFKMNLLTLLINVVQHPLGLEKVISLEDFQFEPMLKAFSSLMPKYQRAGFVLLDSILRAATPSLQARIHGKFVKEGGLLTVLAVLEEVYDIDKNLALSALTLLDHLADSEMGRHALISTALNILSSLVFLKSSKFFDKKKLSKRIFSPTPSAMYRAKKPPHTIPDAILQTVSESKRIDEYNASDSKVYAATTIPLDYGFLDLDEEAYEVNRTIGFAGLQGEEESTKITPPRLSKRASSISSVRGGKVPKEHPIVRITERRILRREAAGSRTMLAFAGSTITSEGVFKVDSNVRILAMEVLSKLASHKLGAKLLTGMLRNLCPLLKRYSMDKKLVESVGFCIQMIATDNYQELSHLLPHYYLIREMAEVLNLQLGDQGKAAIIAALAAILKQSCRLVYTLAVFSIRKPLLHWLGLVPADSPDYASLYTLVIVHSLSRFYKRRDFLICKTLVNSLFNILQDDRTTEMCRMFAATSLAFLTFGNKRYRKLGSDAFSIQKERLILRRSTVGENLDQLDDEESDDDAPAPTLESFRTAQIQESFFKQMLQMTSESPVNTFHMFLMQVLLNRAIILWSQIVLRHLDIIMEWLKECLKYKLSLSELLYSSLMENMPTLSFYMHSRVSPWSKIDQEPFYVCVGPDVQGTFTKFLATDEEVSPIYTVYRLAKDDPVPYTPWDVYWKERYDPLPSSPFVPSSFKSVLADSMFGMGGTYREDVSVPYTVNNTISRKHKSGSMELKSVIKYARKDPPDDKPVRVQDFGSKVKAVPRDLPDRYMRQPRFEKTAHRTVVPTLQEYISDLTGGTQDNHSIPRSIAADLLTPMGKSVEQKTKRTVLTAVNDFYKNPAKKFSNYQFNLLIKALTQPPSLWLDDVDPTDLPVALSIIREKAQFARMRQNVPNSILRGVRTTIFHEGKMLKTLDISKSSKEHTREVAAAISATMFMIFEKLSGLKSSFHTLGSADQIKSIPLLSPGPGKYIFERLPKRFPSKITVVSRKESVSQKAGGVMGSDFESSFMFATYGKAFLDFYSKPYSENLAKSFLKYYLDPNELLQSRKGQSPSSKAKATFSRFQSTTPSIMKFDGTTKEKVGTKIPLLGRYWEGSSKIKKGVDMNFYNSFEESSENERDELQMDNSAMKEYSKYDVDTRSIFESTRRSTSSIKTYYMSKRYKMAIDDVYIPTKRELVLDFYTQPLIVELRRPFSRCSFYYKDKNKIFLGKISEDFYNTLESSLLEDFPDGLPDWSEFVTNANPELSRRIYNAMIGAHLRRIRNIDYSESTQQPSRYESEDSEKDQISNLQNFCEHVMNEARNILKRDSRRRCWYSDILKLIATKVCHRLEGPFGYVNDYLMEHHRRELRRLLGTSVIPMGCLRIGGQLERAILFKFLADQLMIPCHLQRTSLSTAWVEVPLNPFHYPRCETAMVDLKHSPGKLIREDIRQRTRPQRKYASIHQESEGEVYSDEEHEDPLISYLERKRRVLRQLIPKKDKSVPQTWKNCSDEQTTSREGHSDENFRSYGWDPGENGPQSPCSSPLSEENFLPKEERQYSRESTSKKIGSVTPNSASSSSVGSSSDSLPKILNNRMFIKYNWRDDSDDAYTTIICGVPDSAFSGRLSKSERITKHPEVEGPCYSLITTCELIQQLSEVASPLPPHSPIPVVSREDAFSDDQCEKWFNMLTLQSTDDM